MKPFVFKITSSDKSNALNEKDYVFKMGETQTAPTKNHVFKIGNSQTTEQTTESTTPEINFGGNINDASKIIISKQTNSLKVYDSTGKIIYDFPVALGKNLGNKQKIGDMRTPEGVFSIASIEPSSHWAHDFYDGKGVIQGAYGPWFIRLNTPGWKGIGIHGTHDPSSIGKRVSEGCIRLKNEDLEKLKPLVSKGMQVTIEPSCWNSAWRSQPNRNVEVPKNVYNGINIGHMKNVIDTLNKYGIKYVITSGYRPNSTNELSWHRVGHGLDIVAPSTMSKETFIKQFIRNIPLLNELKKLGYGILNEYIPAVRKKTKATGPHLHIGPDNLSRENHGKFYDENMKLFELWANPIYISLTK